MSDVHVFLRGNDNIIQPCGALIARLSRRSASDGRGRGYLDSTPNDSSGLFPSVFEGKLLPGSEGLPGFGKFLGKSLDLLEWGCAW
jgi:hypothetical protein